MPEKIGIIRTNNKENERCHLVIIVANLLKMIAGITLETQTKRFFSVTKPNVTSKWPEMRGRKYENAKKGQEKMTIIAITRTNPSL